MQKPFFSVLLLFLSLFVSFSYGFQDYAEISGHIYDFYTFEPLDVAVVEINTTPTMRVVVYNGSYDFNLSLGCYNISVYHYTQGILDGFSSNVMCFDEPKHYTYDFILLLNDAMYDEQILTTLNEISTPSQVFEENNYSWLKYLMLFVPVVLLVPLIAYFYLRYYHKQKIMYEDDEYMNKLLDILRSEKRVNQKDLVKALKLSDAKISLMIAELEHKGVVKKIKKGRSNIIVYEG